MTLRWLLVAVLAVPLCGGGVVLCAFGHALLAPTGAGLAELAIGGARCGG